MHALAGHAQGLAARHQQVGCGRAFENRRDQVGDGFDDLLAVVHDKKRRPVIQNLHHALHQRFTTGDDAERRRHRAQDEIRVLDRRKIDEGDRIPEIRVQLLVSRLSDRPTIRVARRGSGAAASAVAELTCRSRALPRWFTGATKQ